MDEMIYVIATPIGSLSDISSNAVDAIRECDELFCEDTRTTMNILSRFGIKGKMLISYREENEKKMSETAIKHVLEGKRIGIVSDAGMPGIADPGYRILSAACEKGIKVKVIHGQTAFLDALLKSGFGTDAFLFGGFFPQKASKRASYMELLKENDITGIFYESPHRILKTLLFLKDAFPVSRIAVCRELTKVHEEIKVFETSALREEDITVKGEFTLVLRRKK